MCQKQHQDDENEEIELEQSLAQELNKDNRNLRNTMSYTNINKYTKLEQLNQPRSELKT